MIRYTTATFCIVILLFSVSASQAIADETVNIALHRPYTLSKKPNYSLTKDAGDKTQLTDGRIYTGSKSFWTQKSTVGWSHAYRPVYITVDLGKIKPISGASIHCGGGASGVAYPRSVAVLVSNDGKHFSFVGDLVRMTEKPLPRIYGKSSTGSYTTTALHTKGRYVRFAILAASNYVFCDEVKVYKGKSSWLKEPVGGHANTGSKYLMDPLRLTQLGVHTRVLRDLQTVEKLAAKYQIADKLKDTFNTLHDKLSKMRYPTNLNGFKATVPVNNLDRQIFALRAKILKKQKFSQLVLWHTRAFAPLNLFATPPDKSSVPHLRASLMNNERRASVFNITNTSSRAKTIEFSITGLSGGDNPKYIKPSKVAWVDTRLGKAVASALLPLKLSNNKYNITIPAGMTQQIWLSFRPEHVKSGDYTGKINFSVADGNWNKSIPLSLHIAPLGMADNLNFSTSTWDYIYGMKYGVSKHNRQASRKFIKSQKVINTVATTARSAPLPTRNDYDKDGNLIGKIDFSKWDAFVKFWQPMKHYYVFINKKRSTSFKGFKAGTKAFNRAIKQWAGAWAKHNTELGIKPGQVLVTFVDEPLNKAQLKTTYYYGKAFRNGTQRIHLFCDIHAQSINTKWGSKAMQFYNVICPTHSGYSRLNKTKKSSYSQLVLEGKELWMYSCAGSVRQFDATYYRMQPWAVLAAGGSGQGFWSFGDTGRATNSWNPYTAIGRSNFTPEYLGKYKVTSSKHWQAICQGAEDVQYFYMLKEKVKQLKKEGGHLALVNQAEHVLNNLPKNTIERAKQKFGHYYNRHRNGSSYFAKTARLKVLKLLETMQGQISR